MSLTSALNTAQSSLTNSARQTSIVSRNISNTYNADYTRRQAVLASTAPGARVVTITRAADAALSRQNTDALSVWSAQDVLITGLERLNLTVNGVDNQTSAARKLGELQVALQNYSTTPADPSLAANAVSVAGDVVRMLNNGTQAIQQLRTDADADIAQSVGRLNTLLADLDKINTDVMTATRLGRDASEALDQRDGLVKQIAEIVPVTASVRGDNDLVIFTKGGVTLFEAGPRNVSFQASPLHTATTTGRQVLVDGIPLSAGTGSDTTASGSLAGLLQLRDVIAPQMQAQLDEVARGLITAFSETGPDGTGGPAVGLFTWPTGTIPPAGTTVTGLAGLIGINAAYDPAQGGNALALRDGTTVPANAGGEVGYSGQILRFMDNFGAAQTFDPSAGVVGATSLSSYATASISWLENNRQTASVAAEKKNATLMRTSEALSNRTGVNVDDELARLLELEQSYAASAKLLQTANDMLATLMATVR